MGCQREEGAPRRVRLTDQALVAVALARRSAAAHGREPTAVDLLLGLASEPDGWAAHVLRRRDAAVVALAERAGSPPPAVPDLMEVVAAAADRAAPRPPGTRDLLTAVLTISGPDVDDLLEACGFGEADLWRDEHLAEAEQVVDGGGTWLADEHATWSSSQETVTLEGPDQPRLSPAASRAVARVRAVAGGAVDLVAVLVDEPGITPSRVRRSLGTRRSARLAAEGSETWDAGLEAVLDMVEIIAGGEEASAYHLLQAALVAGGRGPRERLGLEDGSDDG
jgi:hypothetical protein